MLVAESVTHEAVLNLVKQSKVPALETIELFDVFRGKNVPPGQKSLAYAFTYRHPERTLTDAEVNAANEKARGPISRASYKLSSAKAKQGAALAVSMQ